MSPMLSEKIQSVVHEHDNISWGTMAKWYTLPELTTNFTIFQDVRPHLLCHITNIWVMSAEQGRSSRIFIGPAKSPSLSHPFLPSFPPLPSRPFPLPSRPSPPFSLPLEVGPLFAARGSGGALKLPQRSPAAKRILVHFELKSRHLVATILLIFLRTN